MRIYERRIGAPPRWTPIELGLAIALFGLGYSPEEIGKRWLRSRDTKAIRSQLRPFYPTERIMGPRTIWTQALTDEIVMLWLTGLSSTQIGKLKGLTRNTVIGRLHTLNLIPQQMINYGQNPNIQSAQKAYPEAKLIRGRA